MTVSPPLRSHRLVPGDRAERFGKALTAGVDRVVLDLEAATAGNAAAVQLGGRRVAGPVLQRARSLLARAAH